MTGSTLSTQCNDTIVLKFGSSVLDGLDSLTNAVLEIARWKDTGHAVVAVVSAIAHTTDDLLHSIKQITAEPCARGVASVLATGEDAAASLVAIALRAAGVACVVGGSETFRLVTEGSQLDGDPVDGDIRWLSGELNRNRVVVLPGFVGRCKNGSTTLLGRGGSDLSALFLAQCLRAHDCRLVKDVDGLYSHDPNERNEVPPRRFKTATWADALRLGAGLVQEKAVRYARSCRQTFTIAGLGGTGTTVGAGPSELYEVTAIEPVGAARTQT